MNVEDFSSPPLAPSPGATSRGKFFLYFFLLIFILASMFFARQPRVQATIVEWGEHSLWDNVRRLVGADDLRLKGEAEGRINVLLLGQGGAKHDGPFLTDTIIVVSVDSNTKQVALLSVPRDLAVPIPGYGVRKVNSANAYGEQQAAGTGSTFAARVVSETLGLEIPYYARLSFGGFARMINELGGVPLTVERSFTDAEYPTEANGYTSVSFQQGFQVLSGERALEYVRSRHGTNGEGSDFARSQRQQQLLLALKGKLLSPATILNPALSLRLYRLLTQSVETNLTAGEAVRLASLVREADLSHLITRVFDASPAGLLHEVIGIDGAYLLLPNALDFSQLKAATAAVFDQGTVAAEGARLAIENGTDKPGLAEATNQALGVQGLSAARVANAERSNYPRTIIYDYSGGKKPLTRGLLEAALGASAIELEPAGQDVDFRIILGADRLTPGR